MDNTDFIGNNITEDLVIDGVYYKRGFSKLRDTLNKNIAALYDGGTKTATAFTVPSGLCAIKIVLEMIAKKHNRGVPRKYYILAGNELYLDTHKTLSQISYNYPTIEIVYFDIITGKIIDTQFNNRDFIEFIASHDNTKSEIAAIFVESMSNPHGYIPDWYRINRICTGRNIPLIVDDTWTTIGNFNPFQPDIAADIVVNSLTKYYSGGTHIAGSIIFRNASNNITDNLYKNELRYYHISDIVIRNLIKQIAGFRQRLAVASDRTKTILKSLLGLYRQGVETSWQNRNKFSIITPAISESPENRIKYYGDNMYIPVFVIRLAKSMGKIKKYQKKYKQHWTTSFGKRKSSIDPYPKKVNSASIELRIAIGYGETMAEFNNFVAIIHEIIS